MESMVSECGQKRNVLHPRIDLPQEVVENPPAPKDTISLFYFFIYLQQYQYYQYYVRLCHVVLIFVTPIFSSLSVAHEENQDSIDAMVSSHTGSLSQQPKINDNFNLHLYIIFIHYLQYILFLSTQFCITLVQCVSWLLLFM